MQSGEEEEETSSTEGRSQAAHDRPNEESSQEDFNVSQDIDIDERQDEENAVSDSEKDEVNMRVII